MIDITDGFEVAILTNALHVVGFVFCGIKRLVKDLYLVRKVVVAHSADDEAIPDVLLERSHVRDVNECAVPGGYGVAQQLGLLNEGQKDLIST